MKHYWQSMVSGISRITLLLMVTHSAGGSTVWNWNEMWRDPSVVNSFNGSFLVRTEMEPQISREEKQVLDQLVSLLPNQPAQAIQLLQQSITSQSSAALDFTLGNLLFKEGNFQRAGESYQAALRKFPDFMRAHKNLGMVAMSRDDFQSAIQAFTRCLELGGEEGTLYGLLGYAHAQTGSPLSAESAFRKALLFDATNLKWKEGLAMALLDLQKFQEAVGLFDEMIRVLPEESRYWLAQADAWIGLGQYMKAASNYDVMGRLGLKTPGAQLNLGDIYLNEGLFDLAHASYSLALRESPAPEVDRLLKIGNAWVDSGQDALADAWLLEIKKVPALARAMQSPAWRRLEARLALNRGQHDQALKILGELVKEDPLDGDAILWLGDTYRDQGDPLQAELHYERAGRLSGHEAEALVRLARLKVDAQRFGEAIPLLRQAQSLRPRPQVAEYLDRLEAIRRQLGGG